MRDYTILLINKNLEMKTKHLLTGLVLPALFAACTAEEIETSKGVLTQEDLSARPAVGSVTLNFGETGSRAELGDNSFNSIVFNANEDAIGARIIDTYSATETKDAKTGERIAWADYTIVNDYASSNYQYVYNGKSWETTALMVEGNYMFYFPYNKKNVARGPLEIVTPVLQTVKPNEDGGERNAIAELYAGENPAFVGYKFIAAENQGLSQNVEMQHLFAYPQITLVNDFLVANKKGDKVETDVTITKVVLSAENLYAKYIVNHTNFRNSLTEEVSWYTSKTAEDPTVKQEAGDWTDAESFLKKASIDGITMTQAEGAKTVEITVEFEDGLELAYGEEYAFNVVLPATTYDGGALTMKVYTEDDMMIGTKTVAAGENEAFFANAKKMTFAPGKRYSSQEYNFPNVGNPTPKKSAGNSGIYEIGGDDLCLIDAVAPVAVISTIEEFEAFLATIDKNDNGLVEITKATERKAKENNFILTPAYDEKGNALSYRNLAVDEAFLALLDEYNYDGTIKFVSEMIVKGAEEEADEEEGIEEFTLGNEDYSMSFNKIIITEGYVTANEYTEATNVEVKAGVLTIADSDCSEDDDDVAALAAVVVKGGEAIVTDPCFNTTAITASYAKNAAGTAVATTGKVTLNYTGKTAAPKVEGGKLVIGANVEIDETPDWKPVTVGTATTKAEITNNGKISAAANVVAGVVLTDNGKITGTLKNAGTVNANKDLTVAENTGLIKLNDVLIEVKVTDTAKEGKIDNTIGGKVVYSGSKQDIYAELNSLTNDGEENENPANNLSVKYDSYSKVNKFVLKGAWIVTHNNGGNGVEFATTDVDGQSISRKVEFASGSSLEIKSGAVLKLNADVVIAADVTWKGRSEAGSKLLLNSNSIKFLKDTNNKFYNVTVKSLGVEGGNIQTMLLKQAVAEGGKVTLTGDAVLDGQLELAKTLTLDASNMKVTLAKANATSASMALFNVKEDGDLTIKGGTFDASIAWESNEMTANVADNVSIAAFHVRDGGELNIEKGTFKTGADKMNGSTVAGVPVIEGWRGAVVNISGGEFSAAYPCSAGDGNYTYMVLNRCGSEVKDIFNVTGGKFNKYNPAVALVDAGGNTEKPVLATGYHVDVYENGVMYPGWGDKTYKEFSTGDSWYHVHAGASHQ